MIKISEILDPWTPEANPLIHHISNKFSNIYFSRLFSSGNNYYDLKGYKLIIQP